MAVYYTSSHQLARDLLKEPDLPIIMQGDPEGNFYRKFDGFSFGAYNAETGDAGIHESDLTEEALKEGFTEEDVIDGDKVIFFLPGY